MAACILAPSIAFAQTPITFQYSYDETGQLIRAVDSTGIVIEYVYDAVGNAVEVRRLNVNPTQLTILGLSPSQGGRGTLVTIEGIGFSSHAADNIVSFNGTPAPVSSATANTLVVASAGRSVDRTSKRDGRKQYSDIAESVHRPRDPFYHIDYSKGIRCDQAAHQHSSDGFKSDGLPVLRCCRPSRRLQSYWELLKLIRPEPLATLPLTVASNARGTFVLVATNTFGSSDAFPNAGNTLAVISAQDDVDSDGDGFPGRPGAVVRVGSFNATSVPALTSQGEMTSSAISILNTASPFTSQTLLAGAFSVVNSLITPTTPQTLLSGAFSVVNNQITSTTPQTLLSAAFTLTNTALATATQVVVGPAISILNSPSSSQTQLAPLKGATTDSLTSTKPRELSISLSLPLGLERVVAGQTTTLWADAAGPEAIAAVQFIVNGHTLATDQTSPYELLFTVPSGVNSLTFGAIVTDSVGNRALAVPVDVTAQPDPLTLITGRVVDAVGNPVQGAIIDLLSQGLEGEFFKFQQPMATLPDLTGRMPDRITRITAVNMRNPNGAFGADPMGSDLAPDYAARFTGWINVVTPGAHRFWLGAHEGARLKVAGATVVDMPTSIGLYQEGSGAIVLAPGLVPIEITYFEGAGFAELQLSVAPPDRERQVVPPASLVPPAQPFVATTDAFGTFTLRGVPTALDVIQVRATVTVNSQSIVRCRLASRPSTRAA